MNMDREVGSQSGCLTMPKVMLGQTGKHLAQYCLGGYHQVEIAYDVVEQVVDAYLANGGNYIETARNYGGGASEEKLGRALEGRREQVVLCSKTLSKTADDARRDLEASLKALRTDHIEFYLFHGIGEGQVDTIAGKGGALESLQKAMDEGLIGALGMSSHWPPVYLEAFDRLPLSLILIWCNYVDNLNWPLIPEVIIPEARRRGIGVTAMKPLAFGYLYRSVENAVRYTLGVGAEIVVCGTNTVEQVNQVAAAARKGPADEAQRGAILRDAVELGHYVCRRCGDCPEALMDTFRLEGLFDRQAIDYLPHESQEFAAREKFSNLLGDNERGREEFAKAGYEPEALISAAASVSCPYGIDVLRKARIAVAKLTDQQANLL